MIVSNVDVFLQSPNASWCYDKWELLPDDGNRYEVIDGVLYRSTAPGYSHQRSVMRLDREIGVPLEVQGIAVAIAAPIGVLMEGTDPVQPDFLLIRTERASIISEDGRIRGVPDLIAEVLSPSHPELDTVIKRAAYARAGLPEYWILRPASRDVLVCSKPDGGLEDFTQVRLVGTDGILESPTLSIKVVVAALFDPPSADA